MPVLRAAPADLPDSLRNVIEYRKSGLSLNHVVGCPLDCGYCVRHLFQNFDMKQPHLVVSVLSRSIPDWKPSSAIDTLKLTKMLKPGLASYGLANLGTEFRLADEAAHRTGAKHHSALYDATLTALLMIHLLSPLTTDERRRAIMEANILDPKQGSLL